MPSSPLRRAGTVACALLPLALAGCGSTSSGSGEGGSTLQNFLLYGGATVPPAQATPPLEVTDCPPVTVMDGGAAIRAVSGGGETAAVRNQISIANVARECIGREDGAIVMKVGVQVRALLGPGGSGGRLDAPVNFVIKRGDQVIVSRSRRVAISIPAGQYEQSVAVVEDNMVVPPGTGEFDVEVGLGSMGRGAAPRGRRGRS
ncbi:hypothetical protein [Enterovirga aerilata]|uniref:Lipoprotein n=1 Tax=Enterovirga aerilata TaxID=2730920 RepID=A0A849I5M0_9HYPH|nr:hypothetical protein [Enterovirga sp. DB1703]NNM72994.1 hypothetical protein [Enterovirga sp. DB1703]